MPGQRESAMAAARFLAQQGESNNHAHLLANPLLPQALVSTAYRMARTLRRLYQKYADLTTVVSNALRRAEVAAKQPLSTGSSPRASDDCNERRKPG